jgi:uncharacterized membrane protein YfcA
MRRTIILGIVIGLHSLSSVHNLLSQEHQLNTMQPPHKEPRYNAFREFSIGILTGTTSSGLTTIIFPSPTEISKVSKVVISGSSLSFFSLYGLTRQTWRETCSFWGGFVLGWVMAIKASNRPPENHG